MFTAYALMVSVIINGEVYESVPAVFDTKQECLAYEKAVTKDHASAYYETACFKGTFKTENK